MRTLAVAAGLLGLLFTNVQGRSMKATPPPDPEPFEPPKVFKNINLAHVISLEKTYVREQINVLIENIDKEPQNEYYLPFTTEQISRVGGLEVRDRKNDDAGEFRAIIDYLDPESDVQYYQIRLPKPLKPGEQQTLSIIYYSLKAYTPLPASIAQEDKQFLVYEFSAYASSAYPTLKQKTEVKVHSADIPDYTKFPAGDGAGELPQVEGSKLTYGPYEEKPAGAVLPARVRFEFTKPVNHFSNLDRDIEVSHWGGNIAFEDRFVYHHRGANLSTPFNRVKWAQHPYYHPITSALKEFRFPLKVGSLSPYYTDTIGNVSTSKFRSNIKEAILEARPRYPIFGGWKYPFTVGWNADASQFLRRSDTGEYVLKVPFLEGPKQAEGFEYEKINVRILLPEGASNVRYHIDIPAGSITAEDVGVFKTYLDTVGRTSLTIKAQNLVDAFQDRDIYVSYDYSVTSALRKPLIVFGSTLFVFFVGWAIGGVDFGIAKRK